MPIDKQTKGPSSKPITPALSSRFRSTKPAVVPRLAGSNPPSPAVPARRDLREQTLSPQTEQKQALSLNGNITPRSGVRNTRITPDSPASPANTRRLSGTSSINGVQSPAHQRLTAASPGNGVQGFGRLATKASSPNLSTARRASGSSNVFKKDVEVGKFFHASDAKPTVMNRSPKSTLSPRPLSTSFPKNGSPRGFSSAPPSVVNAREISKDAALSKVDESHVRAARPPLIARKHSAASLTSPSSARTRSPELVRAQSHPQPQPQPANYASPTKSRLATSTTISTKQPISPHKSTLSQSSLVASSPGSPSDRRKSFGNNSPGTYPNRPMLHRKSASVSSFIPPNMFVNLPPAQATQRAEPNWMPAAIAISTQQPSLILSSPDTLSPRSASLASSKTVGTSVTSDTDISEVSKTGLSYTSTAPSEPLMPANQVLQSHSSPLSQAQANAANARRERKVLDLEISNSSLLAINKTLEKELRKQSAELRRFRRLSRSGRLSFAPSNRSVSGQSAVSLDTLREQSEDESEHSDEDDEESDFDEVEDDDDDAIDNILNGTTARARRRAKDERRLMLDLSKHQQLLIDSQKLTQSIRKCLNVSEDLIKEANQALKYKVGIGDVKIGGRVLSSEEVEADHEGYQQEEDMGRKGLLSPSLTMTELQEATLWLAAGQKPGELLAGHMSDPQEPD